MTGIERAALKNQTCLADLSESGYEQYTRKYHTQVSVSHGFDLQRVGEDHHERHTLHVSTAPRTDDLHPHLVPDRPVRIDMHVCGVVWRGVSWHASPRHVIKQPGIIQPYHIIQATPRHATP